MATKKKREFDGQPKDRVLPGTSDEEDPILKCGEVARQIGVARTTVWRWANDGLLEAIRMPNNHVGVRQSTVNTLLAASARFNDKQVEPPVERVV